MGGNVITVGPGNDFQLGRQKLRLRLRVYADAKHPHAAQQPESITFPKAEAK